MIAGIHHVQVTIPPNELAAARKFYGELLGLREIERPFGPNGIWYVVGDRTVHIGIDRTPDRYLSTAHVAYEVKDLAAMRDRMNHAGVAIEECPKMPGHERFQVRDPFGNQLEFIQRTT